jgi:hypothetical protein
MSLANLVSNDAAPAAEPDKIAATPAADAAPAAEPAAVDFEVKRPEYIPEKFWDAEKKAPNVEALSKSYAELEKKFRDQPKAPEKYTYEPPKELKSEFPDFEVDMEDPTFQSMVQVAKEKNWSQKDFETVVNGYFKSELANQKERLKAEYEALGPNASARIKSIQDFATKNLSEEEAGLLVSSMTSAAAVSVIEKLISQAKRQPNIPDPGAVVPEVLTEQRVRSKMKDERYWNKQHPEHELFVKEVSADFQRLYSKPKG